MIFKLDNVIVSRADIKNLKPGAIKKMETNGRKDVIEIWTEHSDEVGKTISGQVLDAATLTPLIGATIIVANSSTGSISDLEGNFALSTEEHDSHIIVSYIGYESEKVDITKETEFTVYLNKGDAKKKMATNKIPPSTVDIKDLSDENHVFYLDGNRVDHKDVENLNSEDIKWIRIFKPTDFEKFGDKDIVKILTTEGINNKDEKTFVKIREKTKKGFIDDKILFVVNGKVIEKGKFEDIAPDNIKHINVLKGDSAESSYGKEHRNGVIEIELKDGIELKKKNASSDSETILEGQVSSPMKIKILKNPVVGGKVEFELLSESRDQLKVQIYAVNGDTVKSATLNPEQEQSFLSIDLEGLVAGTYYIRFTQGEESTTNKFIIAQ